MRPISRRADPLRPSAAARARHRVALAFGHREARPPGPRFRRAWEPAGQPTPAFPSVASQACTYAQTATSEYARWCAALRQPVLVHRKQWEWCWTLQALEEAGMIAPGRRGLGFGVGTEPITAYLASRGCEIVATDLDVSAAAAHDWLASGQHAGGAALNRDGICDPEAFNRLVSYRAVDMNEVPEELAAGGFDFTWSSCALEHLGSLEAGWRFLRASLECIRSGGVAAHTTEYNVSSNRETVTDGPTVLYRRRDIEELAHDLRRDGHGIDVSFALGRNRSDRHVDFAPWTDTHLKTVQDGFVITSFGLLVRRA